MPTTDLRELLSPRDPDREPSWVDEALCAQVDPDLWFPEKGDSLSDPKRICESCPARIDCLEYALGRDECGIWGGLSQWQRQEIRRAGRAVEYIAELRAALAEELVTITAGDGEDVEALGRAA